MKKIIIGLIIALGLIGCGGGGSDLQKYEGQMTSVIAKAKRDGLAIGQPSQKAKYPMDPKPLSKILFQELIDSGYSFAYEKGDVWTIVDTQNVTHWEGDCEDTVLSLANFAIDLGLISKDDIRMGIVHVKDSDDDNSTRVNHAIGIYTINDVDYIMDYGILFYKKWYLEHMINGGILYSLRLE